MYEYMNEDAIDDELKCIICTQPFQSPVTTECKHTFCQQCIETWMQQNTSCPVCRHSIQTLSLVMNTKLDSLSKQLDSLLVRCLKCNKTNIKRADIMIHLKRCSKKNKTSNLFRKPWKSIKMIIKPKSKNSTRPTTHNNIIYERQPQPTVQRQNYRQQFVSLNQRTSPVRLVTSSTVANFAIAMLFVLTAAFIGLIIIAIISLLTLIFQLIYFKIFWKILFVVFVLWCGFRLTGISLYNLDLFI